MEEKILNDHCERIIGSLKKSDVNFLAIDFDVSSHIYIDDIKLNTGQCNNVRFIFPKENNNQ